jgi:LysM repeat protein
MIETVYNSENGEVNRTGRVQPTFKMPKNIRQVGKSSATRKIYVEDYVMTFIKQLAGEDYSGCKVAVLVGQAVKQENYRSLFIYGAVEVEDIDTSNEIIFSNDSWTAIYENIKKYFVEAEILGWFIGGPGYMLEDNDRILKAHIDNFAGQDKTLLTFDNMEKEESFLIYENNRLCKQDGYYIYYEKNEEMQTYMIEHNKPQSMEVDYDDRVSREIRTVIQNKKPVTEENKSVTRLMYAAGTLLAVIILVVGAAMLSNYDQMKTMQNALDSLSRNLEEVQSVFIDDTKDPAANLTGDKVPVTDDTSDQEGKASKGSLDVNVVTGDVKPLEDEEDKPNSGEELAEDKAEDQETAKDDPDEDKGTSEAKEDKDEGNKEQVKYYTVVSGDSLAGISYKLYHSANYISKIKELNNIEDENLIYIGQKLIIP